MEARSNNRALNQVAPKACCRRSDGRGCFGRARRYDRGMTTKLAISLPDELAARARQAVDAGEAPSVSAYIAAAIDERVRRESLSTLLGEMLAESGGPMTESERAAADRLIG